MSETNAGLIQEFSARGEALERVNMLLYLMEQFQGEPEAIAVMRMISETIKNHLTRQAWHENFRARMTGV